MALSKVNLVKLHLFGINIDKTKLIWIGQDSPTKVFFSFRFCWFLSQLYFFRFRDRIEFQAKNLFIFEINLFYSIFFSSQIKLCPHLWPKLNFVHFRLTLHIGHFLQKNVFCSFFTKIIILTEINLTKFE